MSRRSSSDSVEEKLDEIIDYMRRINARDRMRTIGGFFSGMIRLIPIAIFIWSIFYFMEHGDEVFSMMTEQAAEQAAKVAGQSMGNIDTNALLDQFNKLQ